MQQRQYERTPEQEKIEKRRQVSLGSKICNLNNELITITIQLQVLLFIHRAFLVGGGEGVGLGMRVGCYFSCD